MECYFWIGVLFEPQYVRGRRFLSKVIAMTSILEDIYNAYGTIEELELFTEAIERFDEFKLLNLHHLYCMRYLNKSCVSLFSGGILAT